MKSDLSPTLLDRNVRRLVTFLLLSTVTDPRLIAQKTTGSEVVELSPFVIDTSRDLGYQAENTLSGSRLNTSLRDTASSVSVFTKEFMDDTGITDVRALLNYTVNSEMFTEAGTGGTAQNQFVTAVSLTSRVVTRGLAASQGLDYFTSITPADPYRIDRYEDSRGPNAILFGIGSPGGLFNASSKTAVTHRNRGTLRHGMGSWGRNRTEIDGNKVLRQDRLAASVSAVHEESGGWRDFDFADINRLFASVTFRPTRRLTLAAMGETGRQKTAIVRTLSETEQVLAWYDNRNASGAAAVTFIPNNTVPTAAQVALGVTARDGNRTGTNHSIVFLENDRTVFDAIGTFLTGSYNNAAVRAPNGTPGTTGTILRINDPSFYPRDLNAAGPGMFRDQTLTNYTLTADWQPVKNLDLNLGHNFQETKANVHVMMGSDPTVRGEANRTLGVGGPANPYAGRLYYDGVWREDMHWGDLKETRLSASYSLNPKPKWLGRHRLAGMVSHSEQFDQRSLAVLALAGRPFNSVPANTNNAIKVRNYATEGDFGTYRVGDWRSLPRTIDFEGKSYDTAFVHVAERSNNSGGTQRTDSALAVVQSHFWNDRLVTTFGYRADRAKIVQLGYRDDPILGDVVDRNPANGKTTQRRGDTHTAGVVFHVFDWLSLISNRSSNVGIPSLTRTVLPDGNLPALSHGHGEDYGLGFNLLGGRVNAKAVYFTSDEQGRNETEGFSTLTARNTRVMDAFASVLVGTGRPFSAAQWDPIRRRYTPDVNSGGSNFASSGYEARLTANLTRNWRFVANYSYTDSRRTNLGKEFVAWYGLKPAGDGVRLQQGVRQDATGLYVIDPAAFQSGGTVAKWIELGAMSPAANPSSLSTGTGGLTVAAEVQNLVDELNATKEQVEKRWGVRPHKISLFTAYDFKEGRLKGFSLGGGWRWRSANVTGTNSSNQEIFGRVLTATDLMLGYATKIKSLPGSLRFQVNVSNVFNLTDIIPVRLSTSDSAPNGFILVGGRGVAYSRYDLVAPRDIRFTTTYSF
ncbi:MAG: hypothetical protein EXS37_19570 [Opitutus sp.]|nr:hypothetical protein [Opitutus sp.]